MKGAKIPLGALTILLRYDPYQVQGAYLSIPLLGIEEHVTEFTQFDSLPAGTYPGMIRAFLNNGHESVHNIKVKILPNQGNLHEFRIHGPAQEVVIRPVDADNQTIVFSEIKIENVDLNFRPVRDEKGVICKIPPGDYQVQVILPNLSILSVPLHISPDTQIYTLTIADRHAESRHDPRMELTVPVEYKTKKGQWISTQSVNISTNGICIVMRRWSVDDEKLLIRLYLPISQTPIECNATVRWVREEGTSQSRMGMELELSAEMKATLSKWLNQNSKRSTKATSRYR